MKFYRTDQVNVPVHKQRFKQIDENTTEVPERGQE